MRDGDRGPPVSRAYRCLHVPVEGASLVALVVRSWPVGLVLVGAALVLVSGHVGLLRVVLPVVCLGVLAGIGVQLFWLHAPAPRATTGTAPAVRTRGRGSASLALSTVTVKVEPVGDGAVYVCLRCQARLALTVIRLDGVTIPDTGIPVCGPCLLPALGQIDRAALEVSR